jgi:DNA-directed RNA polymerase beta' subunit
MLDVNFFDELRIGLASAQNIRDWSFGEVKKPETISAFDSRESSASVAVLK